MVASEAVRAEWGRRVVAEYRSAATTHGLVGWLIEVGASPDLVRDGLGIVDDELRHAELSAEVLAAAGGGASPAIERASLRPARVEPVEVGIVRACVECFCLGETVAVPLFRRMLAGASEPVAVSALRRIVADEARHRRFGWELLDHCRDIMPSAVDTVLPAELPRMKAAVFAAYGDGVAEEIPDADRAWGLIAPAAYRAELLRTERGWWSRRLSSLTTSAQSCR